VIELTKAQQLPMVDASGHALTRVRMGLGWDKSPTAGAMGTGAPDIDLDATAVQFAGGQLFDIAFYNNLRTRDGSVVHLGDNTTGSGAGDDEVVTVDLERVYQRVDSILFLVSSYQGHSLQWVANAYVRLVDDTDDTEVARFTLTLGVPETGIVMARLVRGGDQGAGWTLETIGEGIGVSVPTQSVAKLQRYA
jgi:stress response protein SCP2